MDGRWGCVRQIGALLFHSFVIAFQVPCAMTETTVGDTAVSLPTVGHEQAGMQRARQISRRVARSTLAGSAWPTRKLTYSWWYVANAYFATTRAPNNLICPYSLASLSGWLDGYAFTQFLCTIRVGGDRDDLLYCSGQGCSVLGPHASRSRDTHRSSQLKRCAPSCNLVW